MCTAAVYKTKDTYFGRNLDYNFSYGEQIVITPRNYPLPFRHTKTINSHYAILGVAYVAPNPNDQEYPLFYDGVNEKGLGMAGLNFVGNAVYQDPTKSTDVDSIAQFEFIPWILSQCASVKEARTLLSRLQLTNVAFSLELPPSDLHWIIADSQECIVVESVVDGLKIHDNPTGILTNNPPFDQQLFSLNNYRHLSATNPENTFAPNIPLTEYSRGMGGIGLPGDLSSSSRFAKAVFTRAHSLCDNDEMSSMSQFFHILHSVDQQRGCADLGDNKYEITIYSDCYNLEQSLFYYTSYDNHQITTIDLKKADLDSAALVRYPFITTEQIHSQN